MMKIPSLAVALSAAAMTTGALAHGGDAHSKSPSSSASAEETSFGRAGDPARVTRTVTVSMTDAMHFDPPVIRAKAGETIRIVAKDDGKLVHELVLGTMQELKEHAALMRKFPDMEHDEPHMAKVQPGRRRQIVWQFTRPGEFYFACLQPGHFEAGMVGKIVVR